MGGAAEPAEVVEVDAAGEVGLSEGPVHELGEVVPGALGHLLPLPDLDGADPVEQVTALGVEREVGGTEGVGQRALVERLHEDGRDHARLVGAASLGGVQGGEGRPVELLRRDDRLRASITGGELAPLGLQCLDAFLDGRYRVGPALQPGERGSLEDVRTGQQGESAGGPHPGRGLLEGGDRGRRRPGLQLQLPVEQRGTSGHYDHPLLGVPVWQLLGLASQDHHLGEHLVDQVAPRLLDLARDVERLGDGHL